MCLPILLVYDKINAEMTFTRCQNKMLIELSKKEEKIMKKLITGATLTLTICFLLLGVIFKKAADRQQGTSMLTGAVIDGQYIVTSSEQLGGNTEKYEAFNIGGTIFYILAGVTGVICVVSVVSQKKKK